MNLPLGRESDYPQKYAPQVLCPIERALSRNPLRLGDPLPFSGTDIWNAWELTWLGQGDLPRVATAAIRVPIESPNLVESKSLQLYLGSFAMSRFASAADEIKSNIFYRFVSCINGDYIRFFIDQFNH